MYQISHTQHQLLSMYSRLHVSALIAIRAEHAALNKLQKVGVVCD